MRKPKSSRSRSQILTLHADYVANVKRAYADLVKSRGQQLREADLPLIMGMRPVCVPCPPMLEAAFGYRGDMRYMAFHYSPKTTRLVHCDGGDDLPIPNPEDWITFVNHPAVCGTLSGYSTLFRRVGINRMLTPEEFEELPRVQQTHYCARFHAIVVDRINRRMFVANWQQLKMFQPCAEPDGAEVHIELPDGRLVSPGNENWDQPVDPFIVQSMWEWLGNQLANPDIQTELALWHIGEGRPEEGRSLLDQIARNFPDRRQAQSFQHALAFLHENTHDYEAALDALEKCIAKWHYIAPYTNLRIAELCLNTGRNADALRKLLEVRSQLRSDNTFAVNSADAANWYLMCARAHIGLGDLKQAAQVCTEGIAEVVRINGKDGTDGLGPGESIDSEAADLYVQLAEIAALEGDYPTAADHCRHALRLPLYDLDEFGTHPIAVYRLGWWFPVESRIANCARVFETVGEVPANRHLALGYLYLGTNRYPQAAESLQRAYANEASAEVIWLLGLARLASKQRESAVRVFNELTIHF
jgi:tetratricopeptide (TPR) repeat protein